MHLERAYCVWSILWLYNAGQKLWLNCYMMFLLLLAMVLRDFSLTVKAAT